MCTFESSNSKTCIPAWFQDRRYNQTRKKTCAIRPKSREEKLTITEHSRNHLTPSDTIWCQPCNCRSRLHPEYEDHVSLAPNRSNVIMPYSFFFVHCFIIFVCILFVLCILYRIFDGFCFKNPVQGLDFCGFEASSSSDYYVWA